MFSVVFLVTAAQAETTGHITVSGEGRVFAVPDMAVITMGASAEAKTAKAAMDETSQITSAILTQLETFEIAPRDVQTSDLSLHPVWENRTQSNNQPRIRGYQASNRVTVRIRDLSKLGTVLDAVLTDGANQLGGLQFTLSDLDPLMNDARKAAVADARARAELYAAAAGVTLGPLVSLNETGIRAPRPEMLSMARASDAGVPVAEGETELRAGVTMVFQIAPE
ncbi:SIMPL domain-containing protein [Marivita sp. S6314]|uniref:SIMPL domain-containing protein n=1 Tax=Marivita sp. S6314 TaxID=2926406 RepID=UPI001FF501C2|nr:SIMPL domain-containing protein [Marivita sp. S6314]MCK0151074.1 SIMPL domain-containing protein [Marivita sp. S6314]